MVETREPSPLTRRGFLGVSAALVAASHAGASPRPMRRDHPVKARSHRPNILFLFADDQRFDTIRALGNAEIRTPNLDGLVERGTAFIHACIMGGTHGAICQPSRAMLMAGRTQFHVPNDIGDFITFPQWLRNDGYRTFGTGKWHNLAPSYARSFSDGAAIFFGGMSNHQEVPIHDFDPTGAYSPDGQHIAKGFSSELFSDEAIRFLRSYDDPSPFCVYVSYTAPHDPRTAPKEFADLYDPSGLPLPPSFMSKHPFDNGEMRIRDEQLAPWPRTPEVVREHLAAYYAMITHLDHHIGRVLSALEETGNAENTVIMFAGDNGLAVGQHGLMGKQNLYDHSIRVPLIFAGPGVPKGAQRHGLCYLLDVFPTICDLTGLDTPASVEGIGLMPMILGERETMRETTFHAYRNIQRAVRDDRHKLIEYDVEGTRTTQLFDLEGDPWETVNLVDHPDYGHELRRLREELARWQRGLDDPVLSA